jgi:ATP-binding cassette, subfamily B, bacterial
MFGLASRNKIPYVEQLTPTECAAACLAMILRHHGCYVRIDELRTYIPVGRDGANAYSIVQAAESFGMEAFGIRAAEDQLPPACILHWEQNHFVVLERTRKHSFTIIDPALGRRQLPRHAFLEAFSGVAIICEPTERFRKRRRRSSIGRQLRPLLAYKGLVAEIVLFSIIVQLAALALPTVTRVIVDQVLPRQLWNMLHTLMAGVLIGVIFYLFSVAGRGALLVRLRCLLDEKLTAGLMKHLASLPYPFFQQHGASDLMLRLRSNITIREAMTNSAVAGVLDGYLVLNYLVLIVFMNWRLGAVMSAVVAIQIALFLLAHPRQRELQAETLAADARAQSRQMDFLYGIETLKTMGLESSVVNQWTESFRDFLFHTRAEGRLDSAVAALTAVINVSGPLVLLLLGAGAVINHTLPLGTMLQLTALGAAILGPLSSLLTTGSQLQRLENYIERLEDVYTTSPEEHSTTYHSVPISGGISVKGVFFRYTGSETDALTDITMDIPAGQQVAIVGRSGSGKSTLGKLLIGLYQPSAGEIQYDGIPLEQLPLQQFRRLLGVVPQAPALFANTILYNITMGDSSIPFDEVVRAASLACVHEEIARMPMGYYTLLVDRGLSLSGGQRQRISLARALVRRPTILLLDEATSTLDSITERAIQQALDAVQCTRVIIAHRLNTIVRSRSIVVLENGHMVAQGTHAELVENCGLYAELLGSTRVDFRQ